MAWATKSPRRSENKDKSDGSNKGNWFGGDSGSGGGSTTPTPSSGSTSTPTKKESTYTDAEGNVHVVQDYTGQGGGKYDTVISAAPGGSYSGSGYGKMAEATLQSSSVQNTLSAAIAESPQLQKTLQERGQLEVTTSTAPALSANYSQAPPPTSMVNTSGFRAALPEHLKQVERPPVISATSENIASGARNVASIIRKGAPEATQMFSQIAYVGPGIAAITPYTTESSARIIETAGMFPGGAEAIIKQPGRIAEFAGKGLVLTGTALLTSAKTEPRQLISDIVMGSVVFKGLKSGVKSTGGVAGSSAKFAISKGTQAGISAIKLGSEVGSKTLQIGKATTIQGINSAKVTVSNLFGKGTKSGAITTYAAPEIIRVTRIPSTTTPAIATAPKALPVATVPKALPSRPAPKLLTEPAKPIIPETAIKPEAPAKHYYYKEPKVSKAPSVVSRDLLKDYSAQRPKAPIYGGPEPLLQRASQPKVHERPTIVMDRTPREIKSIINPHEIAEIVEAPPLKVMMSQTSTKTALQVTPRVRTKVQTKLLTSPKTSLKTSLKTKTILAMAALKPATVTAVKTKIATKTVTKPVVKTIVKTLPFTKTVVRTLPIVKTRTRTATQTKVAQATATATKTKTVTQTKTATAVKTAVLTETATKLKVQKLKLPRTSSKPLDLNKKLKGASKKYGKFMEISNIATAKDILSFK